MWVVGGERIWVVVRSNRSVTLRQRPRRSPWTAAASIPPVIQFNLPGLRCSRCVWPWPPCASAPSLLVAARPIARMSAQICCAIHALEGPGLLRRPAVRNIAVWRVFDRSIDPSWQPASPRAASRAESTVVPFQLRWRQGSCVRALYWKGGVNWRVEGGMWYDDVDNN